MLQCCSLFQDRENSLASDKEFAFVNSAAAPIIDSQYLDLSSVVETILQKATV